MFHPSVTERSIERASKKIGFQLERHSIAYVTSVVEHLDSLSEFDSNGNFIGWKRELEQDEGQFITNERTLSICDFKYWLTHYAYIRLPKKQVVLIQPNIAQRIILDIWAENQLAGRSSIVLELKARQLGVSTISELAVCYKAQFFPNTNAVVASCDPKKSEAMAKMIDLAFDQQPHWLKPPVVRRKVGELIEYPQQNSGISIQHGSQNTGIARGGTPSDFHLSELAEFENPEDSIDASLLRAAHSNPTLFGMLEGTAKGRRNWLHKRWVQVKEDWPQGKSRIRPVFLPWFIGSDLYPTPTFLVECPLPIGHRFLDITLAHAKKAAAFVGNTPMLQKYLGQNWEMDREQMWFYEVEREAARKNGELNRFLAEMPGDDMECFSSTNVSAFDPEIIEIYANNVKNPVGIYGIQSLDGSLPTFLQPSRGQIDADLVNEESVSVIANWHASATPLKYNLVPLWRDGYPNTNFSNKVFIYEWPIDGEEYFIGVDTGDGVGQDRSVVEVIRKGTAWRNDEQVCEFASAYVNAHDLWSICMAIGTLYSVRRGGMIRQPKTVIEVNRNGETVQHEWRKAGWSNFHIWTRYDTKKIDISKNTKLGWVTNQWSRPMSLDTLFKYIRDGWIDINSPWFVDEMGDLERDWDAQDMKAIRGGHDDRIMALAIALFCAHVLEARGSKLLAERRMENLVTDDHPTYAQYAPRPYEVDKPGQVLPVHQILGGDIPEYAYSDYDY